MKRTFQPNIKKLKKKYGFLSRKKTVSGKKIIKHQRNKKKI